MSELTELEQRLASRAAAAPADPEHRRRYFAYRDTRCDARLAHSFKRLGEIGRSTLDECEECGIVVGVAR